MKKKIVIWTMALAMSFASLAGCTDRKNEQNITESSSAQAESETKNDENTQEALQSSEDMQDASQTSGDVQESAEQYVCPLEDGIYTAKFDTDSSMFHVSEAMDGKGVLTVKDGKMMLHISLASKKILNLYPGLAEDAKKDGAVLLEPTIDTVLYGDGTTDEVFGFDVPVPRLEDEFDLALVGTKGTWYDHKVSVSEVQPAEATTTDQTENAASQTPEDGEYEANVTMTGGTGKASIESPARITVQDGKICARIVWSSKNYDYMLVDGVKYLNEAAEGENSVFTIPVAELDKDLTVVGDTIAMSTPHEIEYVLHFELVK